MSQANIITAETKFLVQDIEANQAGNGETADAKIAELVGHLATRCADPAVRERYAEYPTQLDGIVPYPLDDEGYAVAFDPMEEEAELYKTWRTYGVAVAKNVVPDVSCAAAVAKVRNTLGELSGGAVEIDKPETHGQLPVDKNGTPILTRGFFEVYHDDALAQLRQSVRLYLHHVVMWGQAELWTTYDRFGVKLPGHGESAALPLHVDQNPNIHPGFRTTQGVLALEDCPAERGTLVVVPGSKKYFPIYEDMALNKGEYVELETSDPRANVLTDNAQPLPLRRGNAVTWDSRTTHANTANVSDKTRFIALISAGPARPDDREAVAARAEAYDTGEGSNVRDAMMHASRRPRYNDLEALQSVRMPERLSLLGKLLYGQVNYDEI